MASPNTSLPSQVTPVIAPPTPEQRYLSLPSNDIRDPMFSAAAMARSLEVYPLEGLLWLPWHDHNDIPPMPATPRPRCIPLPDVEDPVANTSSTPRRRLRDLAAGDATPATQLHPALGPMLGYDFTQHPNEAHVLPSSSSLGLFYMDPDADTIWSDARSPSPAPAASSSSSSSGASASTSSLHEPSTSYSPTDDASASSSTLPLPYDEPATHPGLSSFFIDIGPYQNILIQATTEPYVTCWDVIGQIYEFLSLPLDDPYDLDISLERLIEAYEARMDEQRQALQAISAAGPVRDVVRNIDALLGETEWSLMLASSSDGTRWVIKTRRPPSP